MSFFKKIVFAAIISIGIGISGSVLAELPQISDARVVQPPPGAKVAAAYFTISNPGDKPLAIMNAASDIAKSVEVHRSVVENDVAKMEKQESVTVPPGDSLEFKHGSYHVMFMGLNQDLVAGESFDLIVNTSAGDILVSVPIISLEDAMSRTHMQHDTQNTNSDMNHKMKDGTHK